MTHRATALLCLAALPSLAAEVTSWPTLHGDVQRSGFYARFPQPPLKLAWRQELWRELTGPRAQVIVSDGLAFMGTYAGTLYAWDADTGDKKWVFRTGRPIGHSPTIADGVLYFGSMGRKLYAMEAVSGKRRWTFECDEGIWTSPVVSGGLVMFGARDGVFHAVNTRTGKLKWRFPTGAPILGSASISESGLSVVFSSEDMHVYCLRVTDGSLLWKSRKLAGLTTRDYFPVIFRGLVFVTTSPVKDFHTILTQHQQMLVARAGFQAQRTMCAPSSTLSWIS
jgi:outer membrane protein assembly factor BamB